MATVSKFSLRHLDPDVQIYTPLRQFILHSQALRTCSGWFATSMSGVWWKGAEGAPASDYLYKYYLNYDSDGFSTLLPFDTAVQPNTPPTYSKIVSLEILQASPDVESLCMAFENMFKCFYGQPIDPLSTDGDLKALASLADQYDALQSISASVRTALFENGNIGTRISGQPVIFLDLGYKLQSARIFKEAFIHVVGRMFERKDPYTLDAMATKISEPAFRAVELEYSRLEILVADAMRKFLVLDFAIKPSAPRMVKGLVRNEIGRIFAKSGEHGMEGELFREITNSNFEPTEKDLQDHRVDWPAGTPTNLKNDSRQFVGLVKKVASPLAKCNLQSGQKWSSYLTCAEIKDEGLPWLK